jgi:hypothetical protein
MDPPEHHGVQVRLLFVGIGDCAFVPSGMGLCSSPRATWQWECVRGTRQTCPTLFLVCAPKTIHRIGLTVMFVCQWHDRRSESVWTLISINHQPPAKRTDCIGIVVIRVGPTMPPGSGELFEPSHEGVGRDREPLVGWWDPRKYYNFAGSRLQATMFWWWVPWELNALQCLQRIGATLTPASSGRRVRHPSAFSLLLHVGFSRLVAYYNTCSKPDWVRLGETKSRQRVRMRPTLTGHCWARRSPSKDFILKMVGSFTG